MNCHFCGKTEGPKSEVLIHHAFICQDCVNWVYNIKQENEQREVEIEKIKIERDNYKEELESAQDSLYESHGSDN